MKAEDARWLTGLRRGDAAAYGWLLDTFGGRVHALARRHTRGEADAEDLTQEIFVALHASLPKFRGEAALSTFIYRVAMNHCLKHRARQRPESVPYDDLPLASPAHQTPEHAAARGELASTIEAALATLSTDHREVVVLHELHGLTYAECATALGVPIGTVKSRLFNAFKRLRGQLEGYVHAGV